MDGVIVDTAHFHYLSWRDLAREFDFDFTLAANEELKGVSRTRSLEIILSLAGIDRTDAEKEVLCHRKNEAYLLEISKMGPGDILPGVHDFISSLKDHGLKISLGSASKNARKILELVKLAATFDAVVDGTDIEKGKPDPEVFFTAARRLGVDPRRCLVIEDAAKGIEAAQRAGMKTIGIGSEEVLGAADIVIASTQSLTADLLRQEGWL